VNRRGLTMVELMVALAVGAGLFILMLELHTRGLRTMESDQRKMTAIEATHRFSERLRQEFFQAKFAWVVPLKEGSGVRDVWATAPDWIVADRNHSDSGPSAITTGTAGTSAGSPSMYLGFSDTMDANSTTELLFDADESKLMVGGKAEPAPFSQVLFYNEGKNIIKYLVQVDQHSAATKFPASRERSTVVGAYYLPLMDDEVSFGRFVYEASHGWCLAGPPIQ
jgi:prepilin-type N-terminal cleavage/methylation domain-containing protein